MYTYIESTLQAQYKSRDESYRNKIVQWRTEPLITRVDRPSNLARARELGYKAKQGIIIARVRIVKGRRMRERVRGGRKPSKNGRFFSMHTSFQAMAEDRAARKFINCEVLNSYYVGEDGIFKFYEAILLDRDHPALKNDKFYSEIIAKRGRSFRGLTSAGRKHRHSPQQLKGSRQLSA
jgi:large subunit ribosomal protein L15e